MWLKTGMPASVNARALLVIAALVCLCVSSNVGLQFFPLPVVVHCDNVIAQLDRGAHTSHAPEAEAYSFRVPMMAQSKKRGDKEPPQSDPFFAVSTVRSDVQTDTRSSIEVRYPVTFLTSISMTPPVGRAPTSLV